MDNLYTSSKLSMYTINYRSEVCIYGVTIQSGRVIPKVIGKKSHRIRDNVMSHRITLKVAKLVGEPTIKYLVEISVYDVKPFYFMTNFWT